MGLSLITDRNESLRAFQAAEQDFAQGAVLFLHHQIGWQSNSGRFDVHWHPELGVWGLFRRVPPKEWQRRFWILFGIQDPADHLMLSITVEINPPHEGIDRRVAGAFVRSPGGDIYFAHTGRVGGGRKGIGQKSFLDFFKGSERVYIPARQAELILLGQLGDPQFAKDVSAYVKEVARFKELIAGGKKSAVQQF